MNALNKNVHLNHTNLRRKISSSSTFFNRSVIERATTTSDQIVSNIFSRKKKSRKVPVIIILNLSGLNKDIEYDKFKMGTVQSVLDMVRSGIFFCSIDLSDAYFLYQCRARIQKIFKIYLG